MIDLDTTPAATGTEELIANPEPGYRWKHLIMAVVLIAGGAWFAYDGLVKYPAENRRVDQILKDKDIAQRATDSAKTEDLARELSQVSKHSDTDILIQKVLATVLPLAGIFYGVWTLKDTRGRYRLAGDTLTVPGHPPVTFGDIRKIDKRKWERKGIAYIEYELGQPARASILKLDDFAYERGPVDEMLARIEKSIGAST